MYIPPLQTPEARRSGPDGPHLVCHDIGLSGPPGGGGGRLRDLLHLPLSPDSSGERHRHQRQATGETTPTPPCDHAAIKIYIDPNFMASKYITNYTMVSGTSL